MNDDLSQRKSKTYFGCISNISYQIFFRGWFTNNIIRQSVRSNFNFEKNFINKWCTYNSPRIMLFDWLWYTDVSINSLKTLLYENMVDSVCTSMHILHNPWTFHSHDRLKWTFSRIKIILNPFKVIILNCSWHKPRIKLDIHLHSIFWSWCHKLFV